MGFHFELVGIAVIKNTWLKTTLKIFNRSRETK